MTRGSPMTSETRTIVKCGPQPLPPHPRLRVNSPDKLWIKPLESTGYSHPKWIVNGWSSPHSYGILTFLVIWINPLLQGERILGNGPNLGECFGKSTVEKCWAQHGWRGGTQWSTNLWTDSSETPVIHFMVVSHHSSLDI